MPTLRMRPTTTRGAARGAGDVSAFPRPVELALYAAAPLATLVTAPILARSLGPVARGQYGVAVAVSTFALTIGAWGQAETYLAEARAGRFGYRQQTRIALVGGVLSAVLTVGALVALGLPLVLALVAALFIPVLNQANLWRSVSVAGGLLKPPAIGGAVGPVLRIAALAGLAALLALNAVSALVATQSCLAIAAAATVLVAARRVQAARPGPTLPITRLLRSGGAVITFDVLNAIALRSDLIVLQLVSTAHEVGIYAAPASLTTAALGLSIGFKSRLQSAIVSGGGTRAVARDAVTVLLLGILGAAAVWVLAPWLVPVLFGPGYEGSVLPLRILGLAAVSLLMFDLSQGALVVLAARRALITAGAASAGVVLIALAALSGPFGAVGAAAACVVGYTVAAIVGWSVVVRRLRRAG